MYAGVYAAVCAGFPVNRDEEEALAALLRKALREEADRHVPVGDGLSIIRERATTRRFGWARPVLVMGAVAAVAAAAALLPGALQGTRHQEPGTQAGSPGIATASLRTSTPSPTPTSQGTLHADSTGPGTTAGGDVRTVWPYRSRNEASTRWPADVASGRHTELTDPGTAAVTFVSRYVGTGVKLTAGWTSQSGDRTLVVVSRLLENGSEHAVTRVHLVRVRSTGKTPYVIEAADRPDLSVVSPKDPGSRDTIDLDQPGMPGEAAGRFTVSGAVHRASDGQPPTVKVALCDATGTSLSFRLTNPTLRVDRVTFRWVAPVSVDPDQVDATVAIAAWTLDSDGKVLEFAAVPTPVDRASGSTGAGTGTGLPTGAPPTLTAPTDAPLAPTTSSPN